MHTERVAVATGKHRYLEMTLTRVVQACLLVKRIDHSFVWSKAS